MRKEITFESQYGTQDTKAIEWLLNLSKCFLIRKSTIRTYKKIKHGINFDCCKVIVEFD